MFWALYILFSVLLSLAARLLFPRLEPGYFVGGGVTLVMLAPLAGRLFNIRDVWSRNNTA